MKNKKNTPLVSVIILNWNRIDDTFECLKHVENLTYPNKEIVVVDNGSTDGSKQRLRSLKNIKFVDNSENRGFTGGHIDGIEHSNGEYILLLNNDAAIKPDYIEKALECFEDTEVAAIGGRAYFWNNNFPVLSEKNPYYAYQNINYLTGEGIFERKDKGVVQEVNNVSGSGVVIRRSVIDNIGYLYEPFFAYYEETDLFARMKRAGYKILYNPELAIWHKDGSSSSSYFRFYQLYKNRFLFAIRNFENRVIPSFLLSYAKTGIKSTIYRIKRNEHQTLHRAFSNAFWYNMLAWPLAFNSRRQLKRQLGASNYNRQILREQTEVSLVIDFTSSTSSDIKNYFTEWHKLTGNDPRYELIAVCSKEAKDLLSKNISNIFVVKDNNYFSKKSLNLGWLSSNREYVIFKGPTEDISDLDQILDDVIQMRLNNYWVHSRQPAVVTDALKDSEFLSTIIFDRRLLTYSGGLKLNANDNSESIYQLILYAWLWDSSKVSLRMHYGSNKKLNPTKLATDKQLTSIKKDLIKDSEINKKITLWQKLLERHYRLYQIRNLFRWLLTPKVTLRLKLARTKNLVLFSVTFNRKALALELQHIKNEFLKSRIQWIDPSRFKQEIEKSTEDALNNWVNIPVFIICRDRLDPLLKLVEWLEGLGFKRIIFIDNDSLYPPLLKYYKKTPYQVIFTRKNVGHTSPWASGIIRALCPDSYYIVSDPDVIPVEYCPEDVIMHFLKIHNRQPMYQKVGFGLKIDDIPEHYSLKESVKQWESQFWQKEIERGIYEAGIDTTFALYKPSFTHKYTLHPSIRTGEPYVARHLPWYADSSNISSEELFYRAHVNNEITSWNVDQLPERYKKELGMK